MIFPPLRPFASQVCSCCVLGTCTLCRSRCQKLSLDFLRHEVMHTVSLAVIFAGVGVKGK